MLTGVTHKLLLSFNTNDTWTLAELCQRTGYSADLGTYYVKQLVKGGYLERTSRGTYTITLKGAVQLNRTKVGQIQVDRSRLVMVVVAQRGDEYVVLRRKIQPFIHKAEWPAGALELGEPLPRAAKRIAKRHLGLDCQPEFVGFFRQIETQDKEVVDDKLLAIHVVRVPRSHALKTESDTGTIELCGKADLCSIVRASQSLLDICDFTVHTPSVQYVEHTYDISADDTTEMTN